MWAVLDLLDPDLKTEKIRSQMATSNVDFGVSENREEPWLMPPKWQF